MAGVAEAFVADPASADVSGPAGGSGDDRCGAGERAQATSACESGVVVADLTPALAPPRPVRARALIEVLG